MSHDSLLVLGQFARLDPHRDGRSGIPEVIFAQGKQQEQLTAITTKMVALRGRAIVSRLDQARLQALQAALADDLVVEGFGNGRVAVIHQAQAQRPQTGGRVAVLAAGTADIPVAEEARVMAAEMGCDVTSHYDVGVAGLHRLVDPLKDLIGREVSAVVVVAGMEGALPTLVKSLVPVPVVGVPTSVGYGLGQPGESALLTMLNSCALGLTVVNIDNGIGGGATAALIANGVAAAKASTQEGP